MFQWQMVVYAVQSVYGDLTALMRWYCFNKENNLDKGQLLLLVYSKIDLRMLMNCINACDLSLSALARKHGNNFKIENNPDKPLLGLW